MTTQGALIKISLTLPDGLANASRLASKLAAAVAEWRQRRRAREAFRQWMSHERGWPDMGLSEAERAELAKVGAVPLGELGLAFQIFQNRAESRRKRS